MLTPRQRLLTTLNRHQPDRVPLDLGGNQTGIHKFAYEKLIRLLGLHEDIAIMDLPRPS
jgi:uroporphyrinogen decarboxylase